MLVMDALVASGKSPEEVGERYNKTRHNLSLELAFDLLNDPFCIALRIR